MFGPAARLCVLRKSYRFDVSGPRGQMKITARQAQHAPTNWFWPVVVAWALVLGSALAVVAATHEVRQKVDRLETLRREAVELEVVWGQFLLEQSTWAAYGRVERLAVDELHMKVPEAERIVMVMP